MSSTKRTPEHPRSYVSAATAAVAAAAAEAAAEAAEAAAVEAAAEAVEAAHMPVAEAAAEAVEAAPMPAAEVVAEVEEAALVPVSAAAEVEEAAPMPAVAEAAAEAAPPMPAVAEDVATTTVTKIMADASDPNRKPRACQYCSWCANQITCSANLERINAIAAGREDWALEQYHASKITDATEMGKALRLARHVADWVESVEFHAREMAIKQGQLPDGFALKSRRGNRYIDKISDAFILINLPQAEFLSSCESNLARLTEVYAAFHGLTKAAAKKELARKLGETIQRKPTTQYLKEQ